MRNKPRGFAKGIFFFSLVVMIFLVYLLLNGCGMAASQERKVKERAEYTTIYKQVFFRLPMDSISVSFGRSFENNISFKDAVEKTGLQPGYEEMFKINRRLYYTSVLWMIEHRKLTDDGFIYQSALAEYVVRSGRYMPAESWVVKYPPIPHKTKKKIERLQ